MLVVLGDLTAVDSDLAGEVVVLAEPGAALGEIIARQVPKLATYGATEILVCPGTADLVAGHDESLIHADLVALCDALLQVVASPAAVLFNSFPPLSGREPEGRLIDAAARVTCQLRGIAWQGHQDQPAVGDV